jgi:AcrR family transcriptional regulator
MSGPVSRESRPAGTNGPPRYLEPNVRRQQILNAAAIVFSKKGFPATRMLDIATEAGVAQGTLYRFYNSKEDIALAIFELGEVECQAKLEGIVAQGATAPPLKVVHDYVVWYARYLVRRRKVVVALFSWELDPAGRHGRDIGSHRWVAETLAGLLSRAELPSSPERVDLGRLVPLIVYSLTALSHLYEVPGKRQADDALAEAVAELTWRFLGSPALD